MKRHLPYLAIALLTFGCKTVVAQPLPSPEPSGLPTTMPENVKGLVKFPQVEIDTVKREIRVECTALAVEMPLEFFCVSAGGPDHEAVISTRAKPSHIHAGLIMLGLQAGSPMKYSEARKAWTAPFGPPVRIELSFNDASGKPVRIPAEQAVRSVKTRQPMPVTTWIFAGSQTRQDGQYLADLAGYVVSIVNFELSLIDVPRLVSSSNETLEWEYNPDVAPARGTPVTMILSPVGEPKADAPQSNARNQADSAATFSGSPVASDIGPEAAQQNPTGAIDDNSIASLRDRWRASVTPHRKALQDAAQTHYQVIQDLRTKQQELIDQADKLQRLIDQLEREYSEMTTPKPE